MIESDHSRHDNVPRDVRPAADLSPAGGSIGIADLLVIVIIADAAQNGMAGDSRSITEAMLLIATIVIWDYVFDWLGYRSVLFPTRTRSAAAAAYRCR